ncbi:MAG TPA: hypothetical protein VGD31_09535, partial [Sphingobacteriaceae bacterium]
MGDQKIPGIYNYCDRWCERCTFTSRCAVFENELDAPEGSHDLNNKAFWDRLSENFSKARQMLQQAAEHYNIDLAAIAQEANDIDLKQKIIRQESREHPLGDLSFQYTKLSMDWLKRQPGMLDKLQEMKSDLTMGVESIEAGKEKIAMIKDCLAIIKWYEVFIHVKFMRALSGRANAVNYTFAELEESPYGSDADGSAKIALIGIERSMNAWAKLFELLPQYEDEFLKVLGLLDKLKKLAIEEFPKAMEFKR